MYNAADLKELKGFHKRYYEFIIEIIDNIQYELPLPASSRVACPPTLFLTWHTSSQTPENGQQEIRWHNELCEVEITSRG